MRRVRPPMLAGLLLLAFSGPAAAAPILFQLESVTITGAAVASTQTYVPGLPIAGSGDLDLGLGTGTLSLMNYSIEIDIAGGLPVDAVIDVIGWGQTITAIDGSGNITSTGSGTYNCPFIAAICDLGPPPSTGWPPADGVGASSAVIDTGLQTITVIDNSNDGYTGTVTQTYSYVFTPEPGTAVLVGGGLLVLGWIRGRRRA